MLLLPFLGGVAVAQRVEWESLAALVALVGLFTIQEPILVLLRQWFIWKEKRDVTPAAAFTVVVAGSFALLSGGLLFWFLPWRPLAVLTLAAAVVLGLRAVLTLGNLQRSAPLQIIEAAGLSASCVLSYLAGHGTVDGRALLLWGVFFLHHSAALFVVRARLEAVIAAKSAGGLRRRFRTGAWAGQSLLLAALVAALAAKTPVLAVALAVPFLVHTWDLLRLDDPFFLKVPLARVGWREVGISSTFSVLAVLSFLV